VGGIDDNSPTVVERKIIGIERHASAADKHLVGGGIDRRSSQSNRVWVLEYGSTRIANGVVHASDLPRRARCIASKQRRILRRGDWRILATVEGCKRIAKWVAAVVKVSARVGYQGAGVDVSIICPRQISDVGEEIEKTCRRGFSNKVILNCDITQWSCLEPSIRKNEKGAAINNLAILNDKAVAWGWGSKKVIVIYAGSCRLVVQDQSTVIYQKIVTP